MSFHISNLINRILQMNLKEIIFVHLLENKTILVVDKVASTLQKKTKKKEKQTQKRNIFKKRKH